VLANIEELERLQPLLRQARDEDKSQVEAACKEQAASEARAAAGESSASKIAELEAVGPSSCLWHVTPQVRLSPCRERLHSTVEADCSSANSPGQLTIATYLNAYTACWDEQGI